MFEKKNNGLEMRVMVGKDPGYLYFAAVEIYRDGQSVEKKLYRTKFVNSPYNVPLSVQRAFYAFIAPSMLEF